MKPALAQGFAAVLFRWLASLEPDDLAHRRCARAEVFLNPSIRCVVRCPGPRGLLLLQRGPLGPAHGAA